MKLSLKEKHLVIFLCHKKKTCFMQRDRETFYDIIFSMFYIFDK